MPEFVAPNLNKQSFMQNGAMATHWQPLDFLHNTFEPSVISGQNPDSPCMRECLAPSSMDINARDVFLQEFMKEELFP
jgi:hypothetical protein